MSSRSSQARGSNNSDGNPCGGVSEYYGALSEYKGVLALRQAALICSWASRGPPFGQVKGIRKEQERTGVGLGKELGLEMRLGDWFRLRVW